MPRVRSSLDRNRAALLLSGLAAALLAGFVIAFLVGASGTAAADVADTNRTIRAPSDGVAAGSSVTVVTSVTVDEETARFSIAERFSPAFASASVERVTVNGSSVIPTSATFQSDTGLVVLQDLDAGSTVRVRYTVEIPADAAAGDQFTIDGMVIVSNGSDATIAGESRITVAGGGATPTPAPSPTASPSPTRSPTPSPSPSPTEGATPTTESTPAKQPIATPSPSPSPSPAPGTTTEASNPGFGIGVALLALVLVAFVLRRR